MAHIYGVIVNGTHHDISQSEEVTKKFASRNGFNIISIRYNGGNIVREIAQKRGSKWLKIEYENPIYNS